MSKVTKRQNNIMTFIRSEVGKKGYPPSVREIGDAVGLTSSSTVHSHLKRLERKGMIRRDPIKPRAIEVMEDGMATNVPKGGFIHIPVVGKVTAGQPITAVENIEEYLPLPDRMASDENMFILNVEGDSMINADIYDGDMVFVQQQPTAENGDIIVAMTDEGETTVKRFYKQLGHIRLQPENPSMEPIFLRDVSVLGKVSGVFRAIH